MTDQEIQQALWKQTEVLKNHAEMLNKSMRLHQAGIRLQAIVSVIFLGILLLVILPVAFFAPEIRGIFGKLSKLWQALFAFFGVSGATLLGILHKKIFQLVEKAMFAYVNKRDRETS